MAPQCWQDGVGFTTIAQSFAPDIAYSDSPAASRALPGFGNVRIETDIDPSQAHPPVAVATNEVDAAARWLRAAGHQGDRLITLLETHPAPRSNSSMPPGDPRPWRSPALGAALSRRGTDKGGHLEIGIHLHKTWRPGHRVRRNAWSNHPRSVHVLLRHRPRSISRGGGRSRVRRACSADRPALSWMSALAWYGRRRDDLHDRCRHGRLGNGE